MIARVLVSPDADLASIATAAGQPDFEKRHYELGHLYVQGVTQAALDAALSAYDHAATLVKIERAEFKKARQLAVDSIVVTTAAGNQFDGDEVSQGRMARAIVALPAGATVLWVLADNTVIEATSDELREALVLAGAEQARLWTA